MRAYVVEADESSARKTRKRVLRREKKEWVTPLATGRGQGGQIALPSLVKTMSAEMGGRENAEEREEATRNREGEGRARGGRGEERERKRKRAEEAELGGCCSFQRSSIQVERALRSLAFN